MNRFIDLRIQVFCVALLILLGAAAWQDRRAASSATLKRRGPSPVGRTGYEFEDPSRPRPLKVYVWYPAIPGDTIRRSLIVLAPAMGRGPLDYTAIAANMASLGYVVAGVSPANVGRIDLEHRERAQPLVEAWIQDYRFTVDRLKKDPQFRGRIAWNRVGIAGHSFGGAAAMQALAADDRFQRAVNMDGAPEGRPVTGLRRPALFLLGAPLPAAQKALNDQILREIHATCDPSYAGCQIIDHAEAGHMNFSDAGLAPSPIRFLRARQDLGDIDGKAFLDRVVDHLQNFFGEM